MKKISLLLISLLYFYSISQAQINTSGKEYYITNGGGGWYPVLLSIASKHNTTVDLHFLSDPSYDQTLTVVAGTVSFIELSLEEIALITNYTAGTISDKSLHIVADSNIVLHLASNATANQDAMLIHPVYCQPEQDSVVFYPISPDVSFATSNGFIIVGQCEGTTLEIIAQEDFGGYTGGVPFTITLNKGETFWISSEGGNNQTGTKVKVVSGTCPNPINIFTTNELNFITYPAGGDLSEGCCADLTMEQNQQIGWWDTLYHYVPFYSLPHLGIIRLVSASDNNPIYFDGTLVKTLATDIPWDTLLTNPTVIRSEQSIGMSQIMLSHPSDDIGSSIYIPGDPAQLWAPPLKYGIRESLFQSFPVEYLSEYDTLKTVLTLVAKATTPTLLDGTDISAAYISFPGDPDYVYQTVLLDSGTVYHLEAERPVIAYITRLMHYGSLAYALGDTKVMPPLIRDTLEGIIDTMYFCGKESMKLTAGDADEYFWSTGATTPSVEVSETGEYSVYTSLWEEGCFKDLVKHTFLVLDAWYVPALGNDTLVCGKGPITLTPDVTADSYLWQDGSIGEKYYASETGKYWVTTNNDNCLSSDTINITFVDLVAYLGENVPLCMGEEISILLSVNPMPGADILWNTGEDGESIHISDTGTYYVVIAYPPCNATDSIWIFSEMCNCNVAIPSVFSPNSDGVNDVFLLRIEDECMVTEYSLSVFNRWGQRVFHSSDINTGWDGTFNGIRCDLGVYFYSVKMKTGTQHYDKTYKGDITLLR